MTSATSIAKLLARAWLTYQRSLSNFLLSSCDDCGSFDCHCSRDPFGNLITADTDWRP